jgi:hypothetical protein
MGRLIYELDKQEHKDLATRNIYDPSEPPYTIQLGGQSLVLTLEGAAEHNIQKLIKEVTLRQKVASTPVQPQQPPQQLNGQQLMIEHRRTGKIKLSDQIQMALSEGEKTLGELAAATGRRKGTIYSSLSRPAYKGMYHRTHRGRRTFWSLNKAASSSVAAAKRSTATTTFTQGPEKDAAADARVDAIQEYLRTTGPSSASDIANATNIPISGVYYVMATGRRRREFVNKAGRWRLREQTLDGLVRKNARSNGK